MKNVIIREEQTLTAAESPFWSAKGQEVLRPRVQNNSLLPEMQERLDGTSELFGPGWMSVEIHRGVVYLGTV